MDYGLLTYDDGQSGKFNVGDHIQSLAAEQYLPQVDKYIYRDKLNEKNLTNEVALIMNGWFTYHPENWPPNELINPLFVSFHLNSNYTERLLGNKDNVEYLKKHSPIGCRDVGTVSAFKKYGIDAYYSSCLTTTLDLKYHSEQKTDDIYIVDVFYKNDYKLLYKEFPKRILPHIANGKFFKRNERDKLIKSIIPEDVLKKAKYITHSYWNKDYNDDQRFQLGEDILRKYATAKLVITSRIHCALPCLALGTPVIFVTGGDLNNVNEMSRLKGIIEHMNVITVNPLDLDSSVVKEINILDPKKIDWNNIKNPTSYKAYAEELKAKCSQFIKESK
jgi:hypothetical protein